ncbi:hypothetical protein PL2TA16_02912 [Pseudoalteromonas luteoviolacea 2ta16]|uniref:Uncharacterized protein n=1 Tax=Pseudoalteromonas luteoviolacea (strain 2ta16) TaxID=1353533 RepID=V4HV83_PSEL2|nr:hypothetical protein PL2TA16_02912 [Pseudoalteromonas luteoviolacea 2ta16]
MPNSPITILWMGVPFNLTSFPSRLKCRVLIYLVSLTIYEFIQGDLLNLLCSEVGGL